MEVIADSMAEKSTASISIYYVNYYNRYSIKITGFLFEFTH